MPIKNRSGAERAPTDIEQRLNRSETPYNERKMNTVSNNKLEIFERQERGLRPTVALLSYVKKNADGNRLNVRKGTLERAFGKKRRTINGWIRTLCIEGVIKYKTSGQIFINPEMFFEGSEDDFNKIKSDFGEFRSDIK